jgi:hypothetical protein
LIELIKDGQEQKVIRPDYDSDKIAEILSSIILSVVFDWFRAGQKDAVSLKNYSDFILEVFLRGAGKGK